MSDTTTSTIPVSGQQADLVGANALRQAAKALGVLIEVEGPSRYHTGKTYGPPPEPIRYRAAAAVRFTVTALSIAEARELAADRLDEIDEIDRYSCLEVAEDSQ